MIDYETIVAAFCSDHQLQIEWSIEMPEGCETANGTFDVVQNTLFLNAAQLSSVPEQEALFYLFHELRHVLQYTQPQQFSEAIQRSLRYVLMYDGTCFQLADGAWLECHIDGSAQFTRDAYLGQPYELDANRYAYEQVKRRCGPSQALDELYSFLLPEHFLSDEEYLALYRRIDQLLA